MINITNYKNNLATYILNDIEYPKSYVPQITNDDIKRGYIYRFFVQKNNQLGIIEVNELNYINIPKFLYSKISLKWVIIGNKYDVVKNNIIYEFGVFTLNKNTIFENETKMPGIKNKVTDYLEFWTQ